MPKPEQDELVSTADLAEAWGVHVRTVHRMVKRGHLTPYLQSPGPRGAFLFRREDVEQHPMRAA